MNTELLAMIIATLYIGIGWPTLYFTAKYSFKGDYYTWSGQKLDKKEVDLLLSAQLIFPIIGWVAFIFNRQNIVPSEKGFWA